MKNSLIAFVITVLSTSMAMAGDGASGGSGGTAGQGGIFGPAAVVKQGKFLIGAEAQLQFSGPDALGLLGHFRYGLMPRFEINGDLGIMRGELYVGGGVDYQAVGDKKGGIGVLVRGAGFVNTDGMGSGLQAACMVGNQFDLVNIYGGLDTRFIVDPVDETVFTLVGGIQIPFQRKMAFVGEIGVDIGGDKQSYLSGGVLFGL
jgi:hypothetical protein